MITTVLFSYNRLAWNDKYVVFNLGHNVKEWIKDLDYYLENYRAKSRVGEIGLKKRLHKNGMI